MITLINKVDPATIEELRAYCRSKFAIATQDRSNYSNNRHNLWLFKHYHLMTKQITEAYTDERIHKFSQRAYPGCNIGLLNFHGTFNNTKSSGLIKPHRDAGYARPIARLINLGHCTFGYDSKQYELTDGQIIEFNCKLPHSVDAIHSAERFSLVFWTLK